MRYIVVRLGMPPMALSPGFHVVIRSAGMIPAICVAALALCENVASCVRRRLPFPESSPAKALVSPIVIVAAKNVMGITNDAQGTRSNIRHMAASDWLDDKQ